MIFFPSIANHKCTLSDRQMYPSLVDPAVRQIRNYSKFGDSCP